MKKDLENIDNKLDFVVEQDKKIIETNEEISTKLNLIINHSLMIVFLILSITFITAINIFLQYVEK